MWIKSSFKAIQTQIIIQAIEEYKAVQKACCYLPAG